MEKRKIILPFLLSLLLLSCNQMKIIFTSSDLLSLLNSLDYSYLSVSGGKLPVTVDIHILGTVTISSKQLIIPTECSAIDYCRAMVSFDKQYETDAISLNETEMESLLTLKNVTLRFRPVIANLGGPPPVGDNYMKYPVIQLLQPSYKQCENTDIKCDMDKICYENYDSYCLYCEQLTQLECNCRNIDGVYADGTYCRIITGDDTYIDGECRSGKCEEL